MADPLRLLFELDAEGEPAVKEFKRVRAAFAAELQGFKKLAAQAVKTSVPSSRPNDGAAATAIANNTRLIEREERRRTAEAIKGANQRLREEQRTAREVARIMAETARQAAAQERIRERAAKNLADVQIREAKRAAREFERSLAPARAPSTRGGSAALLAGAAGGVTALLGVSAVNEIRQAATAWFEYSSSLEATKIAFTTMLGSEQAALRHLQELQQFALTTPFEFSDLVEASQRMQALGFQAKQVVPILTDVGNAVAAAGGGSERLDRVVLAIAQIQSKGKVATQELNQLAEAGVPGWKILEQQLGKSRAELVKMVEQGQISSKVFIDAFQKFSQINFGGLMEKQSKTAIGALSNIKDAVLQLSDRAFEPLFDLISDGLASVAKDLQTNQSSWEAWGRTISTSVATNVRGIISLISELKNLDRQIAETLDLPALQEEVKRAAEEQERSTNAQLAIALALINQLRGRIAGGAPPGGKPQRFEDEGEFAIAGDVPSPLPKSTKDLLEDNEKKKAKSVAEFEAAQKRVRELARQNTLEQLQAEENDIKRSLDRRAISFSDYYQRLADLENARNLKIVSSIELERQQAEKLTSALEKEVAAREIRNKFASEERRHKEALAQLDDERLQREFTFQQTVQSFLDQQNEQIRLLLDGTKTALREANEFIVAFDKAGGSISKATAEMLQFNARLIDSVKHVREMLELMRQVPDAVPAPGGPAPANIPIIDIESTIGAPPPPDFSPWKAVFSELKEIGADAVHSLAFAVGDLAQQFVLFGTTGPAALKKIVASVLAGVTAQAATLAVMETAYGIAALTPWGAAIYGPAPFHFKSAALFGLIALGAGLLGRGVAGTSFQDNKGVASAAVSGESQPRNREFQNGGPAIEAASRGAQDGSGGLIGRAVAPLVQRLEAMEEAREQREQAREQRDNVRTSLIVRAFDNNTGALSTIENARPDDVFMKVNPTTVARQNLQGVKEAYEVVPELLGLLNIQ